MTAAVLIIFVALLMMGVPVAFTMLLVSIVWLGVDVGWSALPIVAQRSYAGITSFPLLAVPFFILTGIVMNNTGVTEVIFKLVRQTLGRVRGGVGHGNVLASVIFSGMSGSAVADSAGLGTVEIKAMVDNGYSRSFAAAVTAASSTIGPIIPPSIPFIVYGAMTNTSIGALFLAGILPGLLMAVCMMAVVYWMARKQNVPRETSAKASEVFGSLVRALPALAIPILVVGGIVTGTVTPTEASVVAALYATFLGAAVYRTLTPTLLLLSLRETLEFTAKVLLIVGAANVFGWVLSYQGIPQAVAGAILNVSSDQLIVLLIICAILLVLGLFMETLAIMILVIPIFQPIIMQIGVDPVYFGVLMTMVLMIGLITPPVGVCLFPVADIAKVPLASVIKDCVPFYLAFAAVLVCLLAFPNIVNVFRV
tara:strand:+ start:4530 stop:5798 length:1269 start_codon:yes stop_codon:yes gene_type:complete